MRGQPEPPPLWRERQLPDIGNISVSRFNVGLFPPKVASHGSLGHAWVRRGHGGVGITLTCSVYFVSHLPPSKIG